MTHLGPLLRKNWVLKRRHPVATFFEVVLPLIMLLLLSALKSNFDGPNAVSITDAGYDGGSLFQGHKSIEPPVQSLLYNWITETSWDYRTASALLSTECQNHLLFKTPTSMACKPPQLAIVPDTPFTRHYFFGALKLWYPAVDVPLVSNGSVTLPGLTDSSVTFFPTEAALEAYIQGSNYGNQTDEYGAALNANSYSPIVRAAIVFSDVPSGAAIGAPVSLDYSLRFPLDKYGSGPSGVPTTTETFHPFRTFVSGTARGSYVERGFFTLQTLITRFATCQPDWNAANQTTTGTCTMPSAVAPATAVDAAHEDLWRNVLQDLLTPRGSPRRALETKNWTALPTTTTERLLAPLRMQPQPFVLGAGLDMPGRAFAVQGFMGGESSTMPMFLPVAFMIFSVLLVGRFVTSLVLEKETKAKEYMQALGLSPIALVASWYITYGLLVLISAALQTAAGLWTLFTYSSPLVLFLLYALFGVASIALGYFMSTLFATAKMGANVSQLVFLILAGVSLAFNASTPAGLKAVASLLPPIAFTFTMQVIMQSEYLTQGVTLSNEFTYQQYTVGTGLAMLAVDTVLFTLLGAYVECLRAGHPWYFPCLPSFWTRSHEAPKLSPTASTTEDPNLEPVDAALRQQETDGRALVVRGLRKEFGTGKVAVDSLDLTMYEGQITCLLGHNGAGKTTTISMLTGMLRPTRGDAHVRGLSLSTDLGAMRQFLGVCPQHDILYDDLTVREHLRFYAHVKGHYDTATVDAMLQEVGLTDKADVKSSALSGGMKRKLSVGIALIGNSSVVFLDEPSSGMDPYSRRSMWDLLLRNRANRVMILTTHYMEEADVLGDRIAIMAEGQLRCAGSSLFLKNRFGAGYTLTLVKATPDADVASLQSIVLSFVPTATLQSNVAAEVAFQLLTEEAPHFPSLFRVLDAQLESLGFASYGVSVTTLEDVFIKVTQALHAHATPKDLALPMLEDDGRPTERTRSTSLYQSQCKALLKKRFHTAKRDKKVLAIAVFLPIIMLALGFGIMKLIYYKTLTAAEPRLALSTAQYPGQTGAAYYCMADKSCGGVFGGFEGASVAQVPTFTSPLFSMTPPNVFGYSYKPPFNASGPEGMTLRFAQALQGEAVSDKMGAYLIATDASRNLFSYSVFANSSGDHSGAIFKVLLDQALIRRTTGKSDVKLAVASYPLPQSKVEAAASKQRLADWGKGVGIIANFFFLVAFAVFPGATMAFLVKEKELTAKHQQLVSGVKLSAFWLANFVWDMGLYLVLFVLALAMVQAFGVTAFQNAASTVTHAFDALVVVVGLLGFSLVPLTYLLSFALKEHASAQNMAILFHLGTGLVLFIVHLMLVGLANVDLSPGLRIFPLFAVGHALNEIATAKNVTQTAADGSTVFQRQNAFDGKLAGNDIVYLAATAIVFSVLVLVLEFALTKSRRKAHATATKASVPTVLDEDVRREQLRVQTVATDKSAVANHAVFTSGLQKVYDNGFMAVQDLSIGLPRGECFGFLGINGAGKSTTLKMLMGQVAPSAGAAYLAGYDVYSQQTEARSLVGYCPQFDALFDTMTVREHLELYAALRGLDAESAKVSVGMLLQKLNLAAFEHVLARDLSGGNKRKTSVAIAMIGSPPIIILDEPSTGMDPVSRRFMWDVISDISTTQQESTVILTTHSMEECEALCTRVGIMVGGQLECLGSIQHLKHRFGTGLVLDIKQRLPTPAAVDALATTLGAQQLTWTEVESACSHLGKPERMARINMQHDTGAAMALMLETDGFVDVAVLAHWWLVEDNFDALQQHLESSGSVAVMTRQATFARFQVCVSLAQIFELVEAAKVTLNVAEYSVSQTSLETIFNQFAGKQKKEDDRKVPTSGCCRRKKERAVSTNYVAMA
ncbi:ATP-binding Cassette (ABC) Superfamily [Achlya hypogyna]|uniref:ATP-binding Cassette (ABC) Superfamily n=1 Tax=Achlya hypogyna TaxID=1202772 RepID=A0A1V9ZP87_ACHHY|nr:ATP-binding Cassette (ABC) Superfamily [Achlya hypogyna]